HQASWEIFQAAGIANLRRKSELLTGYLEFLINSLVKDQAIEIITPANPGARGCQLSLLFEDGGREIFDELYQNGIIGDWRNPNVIRLAPVPLYNSFEEVYNFAKLFERILAKRDKG